MSAGIANRIGNYHYADGALRKRTVEGIDYLIGIAGAYNAFGLIGPERNGIFVLDDTNKAVVLDRHFEQSSGYAGPGKAQWLELARIVRDITDAEFLTFIHTDPRSRLAA